MPAAARVRVWLVVAAAFTLLDVGRVDAIFEPFTAGLAVGAALMGGAIINSWDKMRCNVVDCCKVTNNISRMEDNLKTHLFGQHLVKNVVVGSVRSHVRQRHPPKALVLSFHGWTGSGKTYVARLIADGLYEGGMNSPAVHLFHTTLLFSNPTLVDEYKFSLQNWIFSNISNCPQSLFIFDEVDKMPEGVIDAIKPFIDFHESFNGVDVRHSIFMFLSNSGGKVITQLTRQYWEDGRERGALKLNDFEALINEGAFNEPGGLYHSEVIKKDLVDHYVPFLPLERDHVRMCVKAEAARTGRKLDLQDVESIVSEMTFWPKDTGLFSTTGCKRVAQKVHLFWEMKEAGEL